MHKGQSTTYYATYFDSGYLPRGLALIESIRSMGDKSAIWVLCLDEITFLFFLKNPHFNVFPLHIHDFEIEHPELDKLKTSRTRIEYIFSIGPTFLHDVLIRHTEPGAVLAYLDADLFFFNNPADVFQSMADSSVGIIEHRYPARLEHKLLKYGVYNVGWVGFRNDANGIAVLHWWAEQCIEWCFDTPLDGKYADQGYLDSFPLFDGVKVLTNVGFNVAPWNTNGSDISLNGDEIQINGNKLVFFHFHGIRETNKHFITSQLLYGNASTSQLKLFIYSPYLDLLQQKSAEITQQISSSRQIVRKRGTRLRGIVFNMSKVIFNIISILTGNSIRKQ